MKRLVNIWVVVVVAMSAAGMACFGQAATPLVPEKCLPSNTLAYAEMPDFEASKERFEQTALHQIWIEPQVQEFVAPIRGWISGKMAEWKTKFQTEAGVPGDDLYGLFSGHMAAALIAVNPPKSEPGARAKDCPDAVEAAFFLTPKAPATIKRLVEALHTCLKKTEKGITIQTASYGNVGVTEIFEPAKPDEPTAAHAWFGPTFVLTIGARGKTMPAVLARWRGENPDSLGANPNFIAARKRLEAGHTEFFLYAGVRDVLQQLAPQITPQTRAGLEAAGVYGIGAVSYKLTFDGPALRDILYVHTGPEKRGIVAALSPAPLDEKLLDLVPVEATGCVVTRFNPALVWQAIDKVAEALGEKAYQDFRSGMQRANARVDMDIETEILPTFGDYAIFYSVPSAQGTALFGLLDWVAMIGVKDPARAGAIGEMVRLKTTEAWLGNGPNPPASPPINWQTLKTANAAINFVTYPAMSVAGLSPGYAVVGDKAVMGLAVQALSPAVTRLAAPGAGIRTRPDFAAVYPRLPKGAGLIAYSDLKACYSTLHGALRAMLPTMMLPTIMSGENRGQPLIDMTKFPPADVITKHLFGSVGTLRSEENGLVMESYAAANLNAGVGVLAIGSAIAIPNILHSRAAGGIGQPITRRPSPGSAEATTPFGALKIIQIQETAFRNKACVDQDQNGLGEYGLFGELTGELALRPGAAKRLSPPLLGPQFRGAGEKGLATTVGYHFKICLAGSPTTAGDDKSLGGSPQQGGPAVGAEAVKIQEERFIVYAWPVAAQPGRGSPAFAMTQTGAVYQTKMEAKTYAGATGPSPDAALPQGTALSDFWRGGKIGGNICNDGNNWTPWGQH